MSYTLAPRNPVRHDDSNAPASPEPPAPPDLAPAALTVTPACDRVYRYSVSGASAWTTSDLLRILRVIVRSEASRPLRSEDAEGASGDGAPFQWPSGVHLRPQPQSAPAAPAP